MPERVLVYERITCKRLCQGRNLSVWGRGITVDDGLQTGFATVRHVDNESLDVMASIRYTVAAGIVQQ